MSDVAVSPATAVRDRTSWGAGRALLVRAFLERFVRLGAYQPTLRELGTLAEVSFSSVNRLFGSRKGLGRYIARHHARAVVDSLGLSLHARAALSLSAQSQQHARNLSSLGSK